MRAVAIVARGACSALGAGASAFFAGREGEEAAACVARDEELAAAGLARPFVARASIPRGRDRATALLEAALVACAAELDEALPDWRSLRVGAAIGTSSGGMRSFEALFGAPAGPAEEMPSCSAATYIGPVVDAIHLLGLRPNHPVASASPTLVHLLPPCEPLSVVLAACASSTIAIGLGRAWLLEDRCDVVLCGGFDAVSVFVAAGFESLRATCSERGPRPFRHGRDGLALGEGAAILALARRASPSRVHAWVTGFGASCDATHLTSPDPKGAGLARAASASLADAGGPAIDLISAHGTATVQNDASEAFAIAAVAPPTPVFAFKGSIGHTLGAAGALELLATIDAMGRGVVPASAGGGDVEGGVGVVDRARSSPARTALKLSSAFGGANAALVVSLDDPSSARATHAISRDPVYVSRAVAVTLADTDPARLASTSGYSVDRIARADDLVRLAIAAVATLEDVLGGRGVLRGAGIVIGHGLATIETNARFLARMSAAGAARAEPRRFPYTTPNAAAGECAVAFGLTGPAFAVGGGPHGGIEALLVAQSLVRTRVIDRVAIVAVDEAGEATARVAPGTKSGAVALAIGFDPPPRDAAADGRAVARLDECTVRFEIERGVKPTSSGLAVLRPSHAHCALQPLVDGRPDEITSEVSVREKGTKERGGFAKARFFWL